MISSDFTIKDLGRILREASGESDGAGVDIGTLDINFVQLGYDSLALLEAGRRIERESGIKLDDSTLFDSATPRALIEAVNARIMIHEAS